MSFTVARSEQALSGNDRERFPASRRVLAAMPAKPGRR
jgi:hypothetical protein